MSASSVCWRRRQFEPCAKFVVTHLERTEIQTLCRTQLVCHGSAANRYVGHFCIGANTNCSLGLRQRFPLGSRHDCSSVPPNFGRKCSCPNCRALDMRPWPRESGGADRSQVCTSTEPMGYRPWARSFLKAQLIFNWFSVATPVGPRSPVLPQDLADPRTGKQPHVLPLCLL